MSNWARIQNLPTEFAAKKEEIKNLYSNRIFPIEIRALFAQWIESKNWYNAQNSLMIATNLFNELMLMIQNECMHNSAHQQQLTLIVDSFRQNFQNNPSFLANVINYHLQREIEILETAQNAVLMRNHYIDQLLQQSIQKVNTLQQQLNQLSSDMETLSVQQLQMEYPTIEQQQQHQHGIEVVIAKRSEMVNNCWILLDGLRQCQSILLDIELKQWHRGQRLAANGIQYTGVHLNELQKWCESLADLWLNFRMLIKQLNLTHNNFQSSDLSENNALREQALQTDTLLKCLVMRTLVVENLEKQVIRTNKPFTATVRLLVGEKLLVHKTPPVVTVNMINEENMHTLLTNGEMATIECAGTMLNNECYMKYQIENQKLVAHFASVTVMEKEKRPKKENQLVTEKKIALLFRSRFNIDGEGTIVDVWTISMPIVLIVHPNQEDRAQGTILWDNAFAIDDRVDFSVREVVSCNELLNVLNHKFAAVNERALTQENLHHLARKLLRLSPNDQLTLNEQVKWNDFAKISHTDSSKNHTFWRWFYWAMRLVDEYLKSFWINGSIIGFIDRTKAEHMLADCEDGTFMIRFSDSTLGKVSIALKRPNEIHGSSLDPWRKEEIKSKEYFADAVTKLEELKILYPRIPKETVFANIIYDDKPKNPNYYLRTEFRPRIVKCEPIYYASLPMEHQTQSPPPPGGDGSGSGSGSTHHNPHHQLSSSTTTIQTQYSIIGSGGGGGGSTGKNVKMQLSESIVTSSSSGMMVPVYDNNLTTTTTESPLYINITPLRSKPQPPRPLGPFNDDDDDDNHNVDHDEEFIEIVNTNGNVFSDKNNNNNNNDNDNIYVPLVVVGNGGSGGGTNQFYTNQTKNNGVSSLSSSPHQHHHYQQKQNYVADSMTNDNNMNVQHTTKCCSVKEIMYPQQQQPQQQHPQQQHNQHHKLNNNNNLNNRLYYIDELKYY